MSNLPFRYPGGKYYAKNFILKCLPEYNNYCEPFAGGASIFFSKPIVSGNILNDKDEELINTYIQIRDHVEEMILSLSKVKVNKEYHTYYKNKFYPTNDLERAVRWFYLNRTSYSGIMRKENCYFGYSDQHSLSPDDWAKRLRSVSDKIHTVKFLSLDFEKLFKRIELKNYFLFIDPPYFGTAQNRFYTVPFTLKDHYRLAETLKSLKDTFQFLLTYNMCDEIRKLYDWCPCVIDKEWAYRMNRSDDQKNNKKLKDGYTSNRYIGKEIFITNYLIN